MSDLIRRDDAIIAVCLSTTRDSATDTIKELPTAEPKVGKWIWNPDGIDWGLGAWVCSKCKCKPETWWEADKRYNPYQCAGGHFCGNCGAKMERSE